MKKETKVTTAGRDAQRDQGMVNTPVFHASTVLFETVAAMDHAIANRNDVSYYGRRGTPTQRAFCQALSELESGEGSVLFPSGVAAITTSIFAFVESGDHILMIDSVYGPTRIFCDTALAKFGVTTTYYDPMLGADIAALMRPNTKLVFTESPGSLTFEVQDIPAIAQVAHAKGALVLCDNTWATPLYFDALAHGADVSIHAVTKYIAGHSDLMMGAATANARAWKQLQRTTFLLGHCVAPDDVFLASRGLRTLAVRLAQHHETGLKLAKWLGERPEVEKVLHPALPDCPGHEFWQRDFAGTTGLFSIVLKEGDKAAVAAMLDGFGLFGMGFSWGGFESLAIPVDPSAYRTATDWNTPGPMIRFHAGLEHIDDLIEDLEAGFKRFGAAL